MLVPLALSRSMFLSITSANCLYIFSVQPGLSRASNAITDVFSNRPNFIITFRPYSVILLPDRSMALIYLSLNKVFYNALANSFLKLFLLRMSCLKP